jgi:hypothetical protein
VEGVHGSFRFHVIPAWSWLGEKTVALSLSTTHPVSRCAAPRSLIVVFHDFSLPLVLSLARADIDVTGSDAEMNTMEYYGVNTDARVRKQRIARNRFLYKAMR